MTTNMSNPIFCRAWAMPSSNTFDVPPIGNFVHKYLDKAIKSCDPFSRNKRWATYTNDINPKTTAEYHMDAEAFIKMLAGQNIKCDMAIIDPPYSPRQISECYKEIGLAVGMKETQNAALYSRIKTALIDILTDDAVVLSFGWNSAGMGVKHKFEIIDGLIVCHGAAHNDTICLAERRLRPGTGDDK